MASVNLSRLRPQITALSSQYEDGEIYIRSLLALLELYRSDLDIATTGIKPHSLIPRLNIPFVVIQQLEISFNYLAKQFPEQTILLAEQLWDYSYYEQKQIALLLLSKLPEEKLAPYFDRLNDWVDEDLEGPLMDVILNIAKNNPVIMQHTLWISTINIWLSENSTRIKKFGLKAVADFVAVNTDHSLPFIFNQIERIFSEPILSIQKELLDLITILIEKSANETAAFVITLGTIHPDKKMSGFIRKSLPLFPDNLAANISKSLPN